MGARFASVAIVGVLALTGCALPDLGSGPPPDLYVLSPKSTFSEDIPNVTWQLVVEEPSTAKGIDTDRIAIAPSGGTRPVSVSPASWTLGTAPDQSIALPRSSVSTAASSTARPFSRKSCRFP